MTLFDDLDDHTDHDGTAGIVNNDHSMERLQRLLTPAQLVLLAAVLAEGRTQQDIADGEHRPQSTIASRVVAIKRRLRSVGIEPTFPGRGRRRTRPIQRRVDPATLDSMEAQRNDQGRLFGGMSWIDRN